uniref:Protein CHUP1, chloroplastic n=1 Tax=Anthurium amnicola TaxID=1678845 RepID=A0A1D1YCI3_9ARAE
MKQEVGAAQNKASPLPQTPPAQPTRVRAAKTKESTRAEAGNGITPGLRARPKPASPDSSGRQGPRRSIFQSRVSPAEDLVLPSHREMEERRLSGGRAVEQYVRLRRRGGDGSCKGSEEDLEKKVGEMQQRLGERESMVRELQSQVLALQAQVEQLLSLNAELDSQKKQLVEDLSAANSKISALEREHKLESVGEEVQQPEFRDIRKLISNKLENLRVHKAPTREMRASKVTSLELDTKAKSVECEPKTPTAEPPPPPLPRLPVIRHGSIARPPPPPPPPPPPRCSSSKAMNVQKSTSLVEFYYSLTRNNKEKSPVGGGNDGGSRHGNAHCSVVGELQNRSAHLSAIKSDVETKGDFIKFLIEKVQSAAYKNMEEVVTFVDWLDKELSTLADERAVLKHFSWPEKKADALREAAVEYRDLKRLETEILSFEDDASMPCETALKKIANLQDKLERQIHKFAKLRDTTMLSHREWKIPTDWMLDSGVISKLKLASMKLAKVYMRRVKLESMQHSERGSMQETLLLRGVGFAYRVHQFAGGLDSETMSAFEELRQRVRLHRTGSQELLPGMTFS